MDAARAAPTDLGSASASETPLLRDRLRRAGALREPDRSLAVVGGINEALAQLPQPLSAVVVGGRAVDYWCGGGFATADTDLLLPTSQSVIEVLQDLGFDRASTGRHWEHAGVEVLLEMPAGELSPRQSAVTVETPIPDGRVAVLSLVDTLIQRLHECDATAHFDSAEQVVVLRQVPSLDRVELRRRATEEGLNDALDGLERLLEMVEDGTSIHPADVHEIFDHRT